MASKSLPPSAKRTKGFTLVEVMISITLSVILISAIISSNVFAVRSMFSSGDYADMNRQARRTMDTIADDVRQMTSVTISQNGFTGSIPARDPSSNSSIAIVYTYDAQAKTLSRSFNGAPSRVLIKNISSCVINYYSKGVWSQDLGRMDRGSSLQAGTSSKVKQIQLQIEVSSAQLKAKASQKVVSAQFSLRA